jgi:anti-sigma factor RsiW
MPDCKTIDPLVTPYIDGELAETDRRHVDEHMHRCPPCHSRVAAERAVRELIHAHRPALDSRCAPPALRAKCAEAARSSDARGRDRTRGFGRASFDLAAWRARAVPLALAATLVIVVGGAFVYQLTDSSARVLAAELTADHLRCFAMNAMLGTHQMPAAVESAMVSGFGWPVRLPQDAARVGLELVGARPCLYGEGKIAHIMYRHEGRPVSIFMLPKAARAEQFVEVLGHEAAIWCVGNRTFVLVAREPKQEVERLASYVQASLH